MKYKVLVIEDEIGIRRRLIKVIKWDVLNCEVCGEADSGISGLESIICSKPDIVISDIVMPGIDGLTLLNYVNERKIDIKFVFLTGYKEFEYAKTALSLGASALLTKPIDIDTLNKAIMKIVMQLDEQRYQDLRLAVPMKNSLLPLIDGIKLLLTEKSINETTKRNILKGLNLTGQFAIMSLKVEQNCESPDRDEILANLYEVVTPKFIERKLVAVCVKNEYITTLIPDWTMPDFSIDSMLNFAGEIQMKACTSFRSQFSIGISLIFGHISDICCAFRQSCIAADDNFYNGPNSISVYKGPYLNCEELNYDIISEYFSHSLTLGYSWNDFEKMINSTEDTIFKIGYPYPAVFKGLVISFLLDLLYKSGINNTPHIILSLQNAGLFQHIIDARYLRDVKEAFNRIYGSFASYIEIHKSSDKHKIIKCAIDFIKLNYASDITLNDVAKTVFLSPAYLSQMIKTFTRLNFVDILNQTRIEKAKELLSDKDLKVYEVAKKVGYKESQYFSQVFKRFAGMTPSEFVNKPDDFVESAKVIASRDVDQKDYDDR